MIFTKLNLENFKILGDRNFIFDPGSTLIVGENYSGKSTLLNAILFCLYGVRAISSDSANIPTRGTGSGKASVELWFTHRGKSYRCLRTLNNAKLWEDEKLKAEGASATTVAITDICNLDHKEFKLLVMSVLGETAGLVTYGAAGINALVEKKSGVSFIDAIRKKALAGARKLSHEISVYDRQIKDAITTNLPENVHEKFIQGGRTVVQPWFLKQYEDELRKRSEIEDQHTQKTGMLNSLSFALGKLVRLMDTLNQKENQLRSGSETIQGLQTRIEDFESQRRDLEASITSLPNVNALQEFLMTWDGYEKEVLASRTQLEQLETEVKQVQISCGLNSDREKQLEHVLSQRREEINDLHSQAPSDTALNQAIAQRKHEETEAHNRRCAEAHENSGLLSQKASDLEADYNALKSRNPEYVSWLKAIESVQEALVIAEQQRKDNEQSHQNTSREHQVKLEALERAKEYLSTSVCSACGQELLSVDRKPLLAKLDRCQAEYDTSFAELKLSHEKLGNSISTVESLQCELGQLQDSKLSTFPEEKESLEREISVVTAQLKSAEGTLKSLQNAHEAALDLIETSEQELHASKVSQYGSLVQGKTSEIGRIETDRERVLADKTQLASELKRLEALSCQENSTLQELLLNPPNVPTREKCNEMLLKHSKAAESFSTLNASIEANQESLRQVTFQQDALVKDISKLVREALRESHGANYDLKICDKTSAICVTLHPDRSMEAQRAYLLREEEALRKDLNQLLNSLSEANSKISRLENVWDNLTTLYSRRSLAESSQGTHENLAAILNKRRSTYMVGVWNTILSIATEFCHEATQGDIVCISRSDDDVFHFTRAEDESSFPVAQEASGAQREVIGTGLRLALATVLSGDQPTLILDEPTSGMSDRVAGLFMATLMARDGQIITVTHRKEDSYTACAVIEVG